MTDADLADLERLGEAMQRAAVAGDRHQVAVADAAFHARLLHLAGNATLERVWRSLEPFSRTYITLVAPGADAHWTADLHPRILVALRTRDPEQVVASLRHHFDEAGCAPRGHWALPAVGGRAAGRGARCRSGPMSTPAEPDAIRLARAYYLDERHLFGCAETAFIVLKGAYGLDDPMDSSPAVALNGGIGWSGGPCGALTGAALAVGMLAERRIDDHARAKLVAREVIAALLDAVPRGSTARSTAAT